MFDFLLWWLKFQAAECSISSVGREILFSLSTDNEHLAAVSLRSTYFYRHHSSSAVKVVHYFPTTSFPFPELEISSSWKLHKETLRWRHSPFEVSSKLITSGSAPKVTIWLLFPRNSLITPNVIILHCTGLALPVVHAGKLLPSGLPWQSAVLLPLTPAWTCR